VVRGARATDVALNGDRRTANTVRDRFLLLCRATRIVVVRRYFGRVGIYNGSIEWKAASFDVLIQASYCSFCDQSGDRKNTQQLPWQTSWFGDDRLRLNLYFREVMGLEPDRLERRRTTET